LQSFRKNPVRTGFDISLRTLHCAVEILNGARVCPRNDQKILVAPRPHRRFDFSDRFIHIGDFFPGKMSTALGKFLILDVTAS
jgi:hypothetical protein